MSVKPPAINPCGSCPYRRDVPSGVWSEEEYEKLPRYDSETYDQPQAVFMCHQQDGRLCAGWAGCHDMQENMAVRFAVHDGRIAEDDVEAVLDYVTTVPLFGSGREAAEHGMAEVLAPGQGARKVIDKLTTKRGVLDG